MIQSKGKILSNAPCNSDLFEGKSHSRLAKVIAEEIKNDPKCTIIGIDGEWGSGKSNLVGMVEKLLTKDETINNYIFFTYDAWGHQNDLPRRSILEELTSFLTKEDGAVFKDTDWNERLENLLAKKKKTSTKSVPRLNYAIVTLSLMVALTPVIGSIAENIGCPIWKLVFTSSFYVLSIAWVIYKQCKSMKKHDQKINMESFFSELFLLYQEKVTENEKFETISEREPSTRQFREWMSDIDKDLTAKQKSLVIVIDNMDRLPKLKVQEFWSAIHSFFAEKKYENVKVIVPFDRSHIRNAFESENIVGINPTNIGDSQKTDVQLYGDDFINKTFYVVYHVAPPILSGWKKYFECQWSLAFGEKSIVDDSILQIYDLLTKEYSPRQIVAFINEFVTLKQVADPEIPDKYIALFIFGRSSIAENPHKEILSPSYLGALDFLYGDDEHLSEYMSSLYYQSPVGDAVDVVYTKLFTRELDDNQIDVISQMKKAGIGKFNAILDRAVTDVTNTENASMALHELFAGEWNLFIQDVWECIYLKDKRTRATIEVFQPYHKVLLSHIHNQSEYLKALIRGYHNALDNSSDISHYMDGIDQLSSVKEDVYDLLKKVKKEVTPSQFVNVVSKSKSNYRQYGLTSNNVDLSQFLSNSDLSVWQTLDIIPFLDRNDFPLDSFKYKIEESLKSVQDSSTAEILFDRLKELKHNTKISYVIYFNDRKLEELYNSCTNSFKADLVAMRLSKLNKFSDYYGYFNGALQSPSDSLLRELANVISYYISYGDLLLGLENFSNTLTRKLCKYLTELESVGQEMDLASVALEFDTIIANSNIEADELFTKMNDWNSEMTQIELEILPTLPLEFFMAAKRKKNELSDYILHLVEQYLSKVTQEQWSSLLHDVDSFPIQLLKLHHPRRISPLFDAFKQLMKETARGDMSKALASETVNTMISIFKDLGHNIAGLFSEIRDMFITGSITIAKLKYFGPWLFSYAQLRNDGRSLGKLLPSEMLHDNAIKQLMVQNKEVVKEMMTSSFDSSEFIATMQSLAEGVYHDDKDFKNLCLFLEIDKHLE